jgi:predicted RNase H-like HicB family nuclease
MATTHYIAFIEPGPRNYSAFFPDLPGCTSAGDDLDAAISNAAEALAGHVAFMIGDGDPLPKPRTVEALRADPTIKADFADVVVAAIPLVLDGRRAAA